MFTFLLVLQVILGISVIALVLLQQGKGADMGAAFGSGASSTVFGARGGGSFFSRLTAILAALFFINSLLLSTPLVRDTGTRPASVTERLQEAAEPAPAEEAVTEVPPPADLPAEDLPALPQEAPAAESPAGQGDLPE